RLGYLPRSYSGIAMKAFNGITSKFMSTDPDGNTNLDGTVSVSGLGGDPYRDGSYNYYISEKVVKNYPKGVGAFLLNGNEMDLTAFPPVGAGKTVMLDYYYNDEPKKNLGGVMMRTHYTWNDMSYGGYSLLGDIFRNYGAKLSSLEAAPTEQNLSGASVYI